jgi:hypothetical protein
MKVLISVIDSQIGSASVDEISKITLFNNRMREEGRLIFSDGLSSPKDAYVVDNRSSEHKVFPGSLHHSCEFISGIWILEVENMDEARSISLEASFSCNRRVELRPFYQE